MAKRSLANCCVTSQVRCIINEPTITHSLRDFSATKPRKFTLLKKKRKMAVYFGPQRSIELREKQRKRQLKTLKLLSKGGAL